MIKRSHACRLALAVALAVAAKPALGGDYDRSQVHIAETDLTDQQRAGAEIWYKATVGNARFHTYVYQQRLGVLIDWYRVLNSTHRDQRFDVWGLINDPDCCTPGTPGCAALAARWQRDNGVEIHPASSLEETYGFDWCVGDDRLLPFVGRSGYRDPACDFKDPQSANPRVPVALRQDPCDLDFGQSTGAMGLRKFPNPRFDAASWRRVNGGELGTWEGFRKRLLDPATHDEAKFADARVSHLADPSIEPPYLIGMACGTCHIAFNPDDPPADPDHPEWHNLMGAIGNQYTRISEIMASGQSQHSVEFQLFGHARPGTVDTSAVPNDQVNNPGTMNAIINFDQRPAHAGQVVDKYRPLSACPAAADGTCWCEPGKPGKCWLKSTETETVHGLLKGGEDSTGVLEAVQRVYFNIGSCSEQCWLNHLTNLYEIDPQQRNFGQTAMDLGQCRQDCPQFRAMEDRLDDVGAFLLSRRPTDLWAAMKTTPEGRDFTGVGDLVEWLETDGSLDGKGAPFGQGAVERGRVLFAQNCARCHSSQPGPDFTRYTFRETDAAGERIDWLGNDNPTPASEVGTYPCRALHSNHMVGHVWEEFASDTYHQRPPDNGLRDESGGGRGYLRNISLLNLWAHAPFLHNNAIGPEICGQPHPEIAGLDGMPEREDPTYLTDFYTSPYVDAAGKRLADPPPCWKYDPSVAGRYALYLASMRDLLHPDERIPKITMRNESIILELGPRVIKEGSEKLYGVRLELPPDKSTGFVVSFQHKELAADLVRSLTEPARWRADFIARGQKEFWRQHAEEYAALVGGLAKKLLGHLEDPYRVVGAEQDALIEVYCSCTTAVEDGGHRFGEALSEPQKRDLTAFLATL
jgi:hypothetical protein